MVELSHDQMAVQAYGGFPLTAVHNKKNLYDFLGLKFETQTLPVSRAITAAIPRQALAASVSVRNAEAGG